MKKTTVRVERTVVKIVWKRSQNAQLQKELLRLNGVWGVHQQASSGNVDSQMTCLHTPRSRCLLYVVGEFSTADNRPLLGLPIHMVTFQAENHIIGALKKPISRFQLMPHLQCCKLMNCGFIKTEKPLHRKCSGFWKNAEKAGILICIHALCYLNG